MRTSVCAIVAAIGLAAHPAFAQANRAAMKFWNGVQATCNLTAAKAPTKLGQRIAQTAIDEFTRFGGHWIDSNGRLFRFGLTEAEHEEDDGGARQATQPRPLSGPQRQPPIGLGIVAAPIAGALSAPPGPERPRPSALHCTTLEQHQRL